MPASPRVGHTFGRVAAAYERTRPGYPDAAIERVAEELGLPSDATVLDLAAGTGKLTRTLRRHFAEVIPVEPDDDMRAYAGDDARPGTAEAIPVDDGEVAAVFVGAAFHWFDAASALMEIVRVLRPGGGLAVLWNDWGPVDGLPSPLKDDLDELWVRLDRESQKPPDWRAAVTRAGFGPVGHAEFVETIGMSGRDVVDLWLTGSGPATLDVAERSAIAERAYPAFAREQVVRVTTSVHWTRLP